MLEVTQIDGIMTDICEGRSGAYVRRFRDADDGGNMRKLVSSARSNRFLADIDSDFAIDSAISRSFTSFLGNVLEGIGQGLANVAYVPETPSGVISSFITDAQERLIDKEVSRANSVF